MLIFMVIVGISVIGIIFVLVTVAKEGKQTVLREENISATKVSDTSLATPETLNPSAENKEPVVPIEKESSFAPSKKEKESAITALEQIIKSDDDEDASKNVSEDSDNKQVKEEEADREHLPVDNPPASKKSKWSFFSKEKKKEALPQPDDELVQEPLENIGEQKEAEAKKTSLFSNINIFKKKEKDEQELASEHYSSLKDFIEKTQKGGQASADKGAEDASLVSEKEKKEGNEEENKERLDVGGYTGGTASMRVEQAQNSEPENGQEEVFSDNDQEPDSGENEPLSLMGDVLSSEAEEEKQEAVSTDSLNEEGLEEPAAEFDQDKPVEDDSLGEGLEKNPTENFISQEEVSGKKGELAVDEQQASREQDLGQGLTGKEESSRATQELEEKYESLNQILKEKNEDLKEAQEKLDNELKNRQEFEKVKGILEEELLEVKDRTKAIQKEKEEFAQEAEKNKLLVAELEEKAKALEQDLNKREEELSISVERFEALQSEIEVKNKAIESHIQQLSDFKREEEKEQTDFGPNEGADIKDETKVPFQEEAEGESPEAVTPEEEKEILMGHLPDEAKKDTESQKDEDGPETHFPFKDLKWDKIKEASELAEEAISAEDIEDELDAKEEGAVSLDMDQSQGVSYPIDERAEGVREDFSQFKGRDEDKPNGCEIDLSLVKSNPNNLDESQPAEGSPEPDNEPNGYEMKLVDDDDSYDEEEYDPDEVEFLTLPEDPLGHDEDDGNEEEEKDS